MHFTSVGGVSCCICGERTSGGVCAETRAGGGWLSGWRAVCDTLRSTATAPLHLRRAWQALPSPFLDFTAFLAGIMVSNTSRVRIPPVSTRYRVNVPPARQTEWDVGTGCVSAQLSVSNPGGIQ